MIYVDEIVTSTKTIKLREWSAFKHPIVLDMNKVNQTPIVTIATISEQLGIIQVENFEKSVNTEKFISYLNRQKEETGKAKVALFMDTLRVHRSNNVKNELIKLGMKVVFNASYSPDLNPIEGVFTVVKNTIKKEKLAHIVSGRQIDI